MTHLPRLARWLALLLFVSTLSAAAPSAPAASAPFDSSLQRASTLMAQGDFARAKETLSAALALGPSKPDAGKAYYLRAQVQLKLGRPREAWQDARLAAEALPDEPQVLAFCAELDARHSAHRAALTKLDRVFALGAKEPRLLLLRAESRLNTGDAAGAIEDARKFQSHAAPSWQAHLILGRAYTATGQHEDALRELDEALKLNPGAMPARLVRAEVRYRARHVSDAAEEFRYLVDHGPMPGDAHRMLAYAHFHHGNFEQAVDAADAARRTDEPAGDLVMALRHAAFRRTHRGPDTAYEKFARETPWAWGRTLAQFQLGQIDEAALLKAVAAEKNNRAERTCVANFYIGVQRLAVGNDEGARTAFEKAAKAEYFEAPESILARAEIGRLLSREFDDDF